MLYIILATISVIGIIVSLYRSAQLQQAIEDNERLRNEKTKFLAELSLLKAEAKSIQDSLKTLSDKVCERSLESATYLSLYSQEVNKRDSMEELLDLYIEEQFKQNK